jgi:hypothetical protein
MSEPRFGAAGEALWRSYVDVYELDVRELADLEQACRTKDELARIDALIAVGAQPLIRARGSMHQWTVRPNPLYEEARQHRLLLSKLLAGIALPEAKPVKSSAADNVIRLNAQSAANARWRKAHGKTSG